ncbi:importin alpha [Reticulomyxa filosa]|uniref:Importin alpha n=1 Tax=Reticulomyxa filosa TaxID=46433 RepID=X6MSE4_RETFI|nr:importin alpha [Reticulomyxa filosa]|eukprot:ETO16769.1 importin alpha [Reticulomyxa filosa]
MDLCLAEKTDLAVRKEAYWCLGNALTLASFEHLTLLINLGFIEATVKLLDCKIERVISLALESLEICFNAYNNFAHVPQSASFNPLIEKMEELGGLNLLESILAIQRLSQRCRDQVSHFVARYWPMDNFSNDDVSDEIQVGIGNIMLS